MKVSEITTKLVSNYLRLGYSDMTAAEITELSTLIDTAKTFIRSYTGIREQTIAGEEVGTGAACSEAKTCPKKDRQYRDWETDRKSVV